MNALSPFVAAMRRKVERDLAEHPPEPDVVDAIDRALALDADAVPEGLRELAAMHAEGDAIDEPDEALATFASALAQRVDAVADARRLEPLPEPRRSNWRPWLVGVGLAAAAIALAWTWPRFETHEIAERMRGDLEAAERSFASEHASGHAVERTPEPRRPPATRGPSIAPPPDPVASPPDAVAPEPKPTRTGLDDLEARAHAKWKAGDLAGAEEALRGVIKRAGRTRRAELAYADLFAVVHQRGGEAAQTRVWRAYLARFPHGRFADDVRAGLCRRAAATLRPACWTDYLEHHPHGAHAGQARKAVATPSR